MAGSLFRHKEIQRCHLMRDRVSGHLVNGLSYVFTSTYSRWGRRSGSALLSCSRGGEDDPPASPYTRGDGIDAMRADFDNAGWDESASGYAYASASWSTGPDTGLWVGWWQCSATWEHLGNARVVSMLSSGHCRLMELSFDVRYFRRAPGGGAVRLAYAQSDSEACPVETLSEIRGLPYVTVDGDGSYTVPIDDPALPHLHVVMYVAGNEPPTEAGDDVYARFSGVEATYRYQE